MLTRHRTYRLNRTDMSDPLHQYGSIWFSYGIGRYIYSWRYCMSAFNFRNGQALMDISASYTRVLYIFGPATTICSYHPGYQMMLCGYTILEPEFRPPEKPKDSQFQTVMERALE